MIDVAAAAPASAREGAVAPDRMAKCPEVQPPLCSPLCDQSPFVGVHRDMGMRTGTIELPYKQFCTRTTVASTCTMSNTRHHCVNAPSCQTGPSRAYSVAVCVHACSCVRRASEAPALDLTTAECFPEVTGRR